ncbi:MAG: imidazole glycerol phosphate synthase subunit HisF [Bacteroidetes bacterium RIFCSPLOWO2_12_FULL_31_6]|nr:MAG: imidazole glycerol phosphate synthase subunit HisF [Bacteroidetes bacterium RIFCSPLOWO2_12_FULL_31_6]
MRRIRIIPVLTLQNEKLVKTIRFKNPTYIGDPINAVKIFNEKEVDEIVILDITATKEKREPNYAKIEEIASEAFMPFAYGGGITNIHQIEKLFKLGIEKMVLNSILETNMDLVKEAAKIFGSQSIVASIDVKKNVFGKEQAYKISGSTKINLPLVEYIKQIEDAGAGELLINSIDRDGTYQGYDLELIKQVSSSVHIPIIACGGAASIDSFLPAIQHGASAIAAGSMFVYTGSTRGILINYPKQEDLVSKVYKQL